MLYLWLCAHSLLGLEFPRLLACPPPSIRLLVCLFQWVLFSTRVPNLRDGVTPAGSRIVCPRPERRFRVPVWIRCTGQFPGWISHLCLRRLCVPYPSGCVARWSLALSSVLHCPKLGLRVAATTLATGLGLSLVPYP